MTVADLATLLGLPVTQIIKTLFTNGTVATINQALDYDTAAVVATDLGFEVREQGTAAVAAARRACRGACADRAVAEPSRGRTT